jgi:hypothetical protein
MFPLYGGVGLGLTKVHHIPPLPKPVDSQPSELLPLCFADFLLTWVFGFPTWHQYYPSSAAYRRRQTTHVLTRRRCPNPRPAPSGKADIGEQVSLWTQLQLLLLFATLASRLNSHFAHLAQLCVPLLKDGGGPCGERYYGRPPYCSLGQRDYLST